MTDDMGRTLADAIKAVAKLKDELPHIVQVYPSDYDTIIMAAEIERLREALIYAWDLVEEANYRDSVMMVKKDRFLSTYFDENGLRAALGETE